LIKVGRLPFSEAYAAWGCAIYARKLMVESGRCIVNGPQDFAVGSKQRKTSRREGGRRKLSRCAGKDLDVYQERQVDSQAGAGKQDDRTVQRETSKRWRDFLWTFVVWVRPSGLQ
jgi:hypothetical protein